PCLAARLGRAGSASALARGERLNEESFENFAMATCPVCGDLVNSGSKVCALCGTNLSQQVDTGLGGPLAWDPLGENPAAPAEPQAAPPMALPLTEDPAAALTAPPPDPLDIVLVPIYPAQRQCPSCGKVYGRDHADSFCACGVELLTIPGGPPAA